MWVESFRFRVWVCRFLRLIGFGLTGLGFIDLGLRVFVEEHLLGFIGIEIFRPDVEEQLIAGLGFRI